MAKLKRIGGKLFRPSAGGKLLRCGGEDCCGIPSCENLPYQPSGSQEPAILSSACTTLDMPLVCDEYDWLNASLPMLFEPEPFVSNITWWQLQIPDCATPSRATFIFNCDDANDSYAASLEIEEWNGSSYQLKYRSQLNQTPAWQLLHVSVDASNKWEIDLILPMFSESGGGFVVYTGCDIRVKVNIP